jgi:choice-of-anchor B domain-containing protein
VADGAAEHGVQVFDLRRLREVRGEPVTFEPDFLYDGIHSAHNIVINPATPFAYVVGASGGGETCGGGLHMLDLSEPARPVFAGCFAHANTGRSGTGYSHDAQCVVYHGPDDKYRGREICLGSNETALSISDVTDKDNPVTVAIMNYPNVEYAHQGWLTEDHRYFYMNDEGDEPQGLVEGTRTLIWDLEDLDEPLLAAEYIAETPDTDHNLYILGNLMYQSNYGAGLRILDITNPTDPVEVAYFDNSPYGGASWSNYPYFESGVVVVTSMNDGIFIVRNKGRRNLIP